MIVLRTCSSDAQPSFSSSRHRRFVQRTDIPASRGWNRDSASQDLFARTLGSLAGRDREFSHSLSMILIHLPLLFQVPRFVSTSQLRRFDIPFFLSLLSDL